jgi:hypothetical protein
MEIFIIFLGIVAIIFATVIIIYLVIKKTFDFIRNIGEEQFEITTDKKTGVVSKNHAKKYSLGIALQAGRHYRFAFKGSDIVGHYKCYMPGYAYLGELIPEISREKNPDLFYFHIKIPQDITIAHVIAEKITKKLRSFYKTAEVQLMLPDQKDNDVPVVPKNTLCLSEEQIKRLVRPDFDFTETLSPLQREIWINTQVYLFQDIYFRVEPKNRPLSFLKINQTADGKKVEFIERVESSFNLIANYFVYGKRVIDQEDASNISLGVDFGIEGRVENPWIADNLMNDVFVQTDAILRGEAAKVINQFLFLNKPVILEKIADTIQVLQKSILEDQATSSISLDIKTDIQEIDDQRKKRLAQGFEGAIIKALTNLDNYVGFEWKENVQIFDIYLTGENAQEIHKAMVAGSIKQQESVGEISKFLSIFTEKMTGLHLKNIEEKNQNERDFEKKLNDNKAAQDLRLKVAEADAKAIELATKPLVAALGREGAISVLNNKSLMEALAKTGSNVFFNASTGNDGTSTNEKLMTQFLVKHLAETGKQETPENEKQVSLAPESESLTEHSDTSTSSSPKDADAENPDGPEKK